MMNFIKLAKPPEKRTQKAYFFAFSYNDMLVTDSAPQSPDQVAIPCLTEKEASDMGLNNFRYFGRYGGRDCYCAGFLPDKIPENLRPISLRALFSKVDTDLWSICGYARQIHDWNLNFTYCGRCGRQTRAELTEHARVCDTCRLISYPRISPAIITAVVRDNQILLARGVNFPNKKMFSVLAGFVSPGETLEECVRREIHEESGIEVKNIRYFRSQPWPFPDSLMIGFTAEYSGGELCADTNEIIEAGWFTKDNLPLVPGKPSLAGELIEWFVGR